MQQLMQRWQALLAEKRLPAGTTFKQFFDFWVSSRRSQAKLPGLDDGRTTDTPAPPPPPLTRAMAAAAAPRPPQRIERPHKPLRGVVQTIVLLVDFADHPHAAESTVTHYRQMLFGTGRQFLTGSMRDYYRRVSGHTAAGAGIDVQGQVHGWFRMPQPLSFYANNGSGMDEQFPRNAQGLARDAVQAALAAGVNFKPYDALGEGLVTALFVVHAGRGAEETGEKGDIWSHKWTVPGHITVAPGLQVQTYLTVPEDCAVGVCAHEWGHLAARWADYYDTGEDENTTSNGLGLYCLMAAGSWGNNGVTPTYPNGMLRMFHGWVPVQEVTQSTAGLVLSPAAEGGGLLVVRNPRTMTAQQYLVIEYRRRQFQDAYLPDEGIAVYVVDESIADVNDETRLAIELVQADGKRDLAAMYGMGNAGDNGDLYPYRSKRTLGQVTKPPLKLPGGLWPGVTIKVKGRPGEDTMAVDVVIS
jgi:immune inhibitor A